MKISENLRQLRLACGMTQEQAAGQLGVTRQALSSYESGRTRPDIDTLVRLCAIYRTDLDGLLYGRSRALQARRRLRTSALVLLVLLVLLRLTGAALLWSANWFFPLSEGLAGTTAAVHIRLADAGNAADGLFLTASFAGYVVLLTLRLTGRCGTLRERLGYLALLAAGLLAVSLPFALADPVFSAADYLLPVCLSLLQALLFFGADLLVSLFRKVRRQLPAE